MKELVAAHVTYEAVFVGVFYSHMPAATQRGESEFKSHEVSASLADDVPTSRCVTSPRRLLHLAKQFKDVIDFILSNDVSTSSTNVALTSYEVSALSSRSVAVHVTVSWNLIF